MEINHHQRWLYQGEEAVVTVQPSQAMVDEYLSLDPEHRVEWQDMFLQSTYQYLKSRGFRFEWGFEHYLHQWWHQDWLMDIHHDYDWVYAPLFDEPTYLCGRIRTIIFDGLLIYVVIH